jgi:hypothetical protein
MIFSSGTTLFYDVSPTRIDHNNIESRDILSGNKTHNVQRNTVTPSVTGNSARTTKGKVVGEKRK